MLRLNNAINDETADIFCDSDFRFFHCPGWATLPSLLRKIGPSNFAHLPLLAIVALYESCAIEYPSLCFVKVISLQNKDDNTE